MKRTKLIETNEKLSFSKNNIQITACCKVGPITNEENYCSNCGAYIDREEPASTKNSVQIKDTGYVIIKDYIGPRPENARAVKLMQKYTWFNNVYTEELFYGEEIFITDLPEHESALAHMIGRSQHLINKYINHNERNKI